MKLEEKKLSELIDKLGIRKQLLNRGYIKEDGLTFTPKAYELIDVVEKKTEGVETWIDEWIDLFPTGVKSGGHYVKSNKVDCLIKMKRFIKTYGYDKDTIMEATKNYVRDKQRQGYAYMQVAHYFIMKNGASTLASACDNLVVNSDDVGQYDEDELM